ncbi:hypothetical protein CHLNCDRAFT_28822, partial [Chlorella variabilis]
YKHWRAGFYAGLPQSLEFERYAKQFDMVELNATFYGCLHTSGLLFRCRRAAAVRPSFQYAVKAPQLYTHRKRLITDKVFTDSWACFWRLRPHLGPILFQLPATFKTTSGKGDKATSNIDRLRRLGEFRDASWYCEEVYELGKGGWIGSLEAGPNPPPERYPLHCCTWGMYVRFHGSQGQYAGCHGAREMERWAGWAKRWAAQGRSTWLAFNNDSRGQAGRQALFQRPVLGGG